MRAEDVAVEELEAFWEPLGGSVGGALRTAGEIRAQRLTVRGQDVSDLPDDAMLDLLWTAFREAAPSHYRHVDRSTVEDALDQMGVALAEARLELAGHVSSTGMMN